MITHKTIESLLHTLTQLSISSCAIDIVHITNDSRVVTQNTLFLAYPGEKSDGRQYIAQAVAQGASAIVYDPQGDFVAPSVAAPCFPVVNLRVMQSIIAARFYDNPSQKIPVIGVTGTNGKTSITHFIAQAIGIHDQPKCEKKNTCGIIGTMGYGVLPTLKKTVNTTPDGLQLQAMFAELLNAGTKAVAMEVSSHALVANRVNAVQFHTVIFTNLTQDHLDFHHTMENYRDAKELLFQQPGLKNALINIDDEAGRYFASQYQEKLSVITYSMHNQNADIYAEKCTPTDKGFQVFVNTPWGRAEFCCPLIGEFNVSNMLAVLGVLGVFQWPLEAIVTRLSQLTTVDGRMQLLHANRSPQVIVDYAHTPDALEKVLQSVRKHCFGQLWCVFGCGGERDKTKRPAMGAIAAQLADHLIITNDNPRSEKPEIIVQDILNGVCRNDCLVELDRAKAIALAIHQAADNDWIVIAGKGHEIDQMLGDQVMHHSDSECVRHQLHMMRLSDLARITHGILIGQDGVFDYLSIDSRAVRKGDCFIAIKGDLLDGHDFIAEATALNAAAVMVERDVVTSAPVVRVANTRKALIDLARFYRQQAPIPVVAITGSCGKTTTRALLENILKQKGHVLASQKSFNNDIGLPLTLLQLTAEHDYAVLEIGSNHPGEIEYLASIAQPTIALVTMAAAAHIEHFGTIEAVAREKGAIFQHLTTEGVAVINADDAFATVWKTMAAPHRMVTFGCTHEADVMALSIASTAEGHARFVLTAQGQAIPITLSLLGEHNVTNALAASSAAFAMGASIHDIKTGLETSKPVYGRMIEKKATTGAVIIDDTYNANPASVKAAIRLLAQRSNNGILVLGDMGELGDAAATLHREVGEFARAAGLRQLFCYGEHSMHAAVAFGKEGQHFESHQALIDSLKPWVTADVTVLIKGSRSMKMEVVVEGLFTFGRP